MGVRRAAPADAMLAAPLSCTSLNKWAAGIADTLAIGLVSEGVHMGVPAAALPYFNRAQAAQPAVGRSVDVLRAQGVDVLYGEGDCASHPPRQGVADAFPWEAALAALPSATRPHGE